MGNLIELTDGAGRKICVGACGIVTLERDRNMANHTLTKLTLCTGQVVKAQESYEKIKGMADAAGGRKL